VPDVEYCEYGNFDKYIEKKKGLKRGSFTLLLPDRPRIRNHSQGHTDLLISEANLYYESTALNKKLLTWISPKSLLKTPKSRLLFSI
jgi:hypothetical protein